MTENKRPTPATEPKNEKKTPEKQTARDRYRELIATDPRFKEAPRTAQGFIIGVARPKKPSAGA